MGVISNIIFKMGSVIIESGSGITLSTISTLSNWQALTITSPDTLSWNITGDITPTTETGSEPIINLSANSGIVNMEITPTSGITQFSLGSEGTDLEVTDINIDGLDNLVGIIMVSQSTNTVNISNCNSLLNLNCYLNNITIIDVSTLPNLESLWVWQNNLSTLDISNNTSLFSLSCHSNNLPESTTNQILSDLVANGVTNGSLSYRNNETGQGVTDRTTLVTRGWTIVDFAT